MSFAVVYHARVVHDDILKLDKTNARRIRSAIEEKLTIRPEVFGIPLRQSLRGHRKLRVGDYRVVFRIQGKKVIISAILHRSVVYEIAEHRR